MEMLIYCPICKKPLFNSFPTTSFSKKPALEKVCFQADHRVNIKSTKFNEDIVKSLSIGLKYNQYWNYMNWFVDPSYFIFQKTFVYTEPHSIIDKTPLRLPYFEPDFSDINKLLQKISKLIVFS